MHDHDNLRRREFLGTVGGLSIATLISQGLFAADEHQGDMIYRKLGRTGERVSAIGLGGYHIGIPQEERESIHLIRSAIRPRHHLHGQFLGLHGRQVGSADG